MLKKLLIFVGSLIFIVAIIILYVSGSYLMSLGYTPSEAKYMQVGYIWILAVLCYIIYAIYKKISKRTNK